MLSQVISESQEWRNYEDGNSYTDATRCGAAIDPLMIESSYGTSIGRRRYHSSDRKIQKLNDWTIYPHLERTYKEVADHLHFIGSSHGLTANIIHTAQEYYFQISSGSKESSTEHRGDVRSGIIGACLYYACRTHDVNRSIEDIAKITATDPSDLLVGVKIVADLLKELLPSYYSALTPIDMLDKFCNRLNFSDDVVLLTHKTCQWIVKMGIVSKFTPKTIAGGSIWFVVKMLSLPVSKEEVLKACELSLPSLLKIYDILRSFCPKIIGGLDL